MKKRLFALVSAVLALMMVAGCSGAGSSEGTVDADGNWVWERKVEIVCPWGVGGGADATIRPMADLLTKKLGVQVSVNNIEGAGGVNGVEYVYKQPADGYTYMLGTQSLIMADLQGIPTMNYKEEFVPVAKLVHSINIIAASKKAAEGKYTNFSELIEYVNAHPDEVSVGMLSATGADAAGLRQTLEGLPIKEVPYGSGSEMNAAIAGGHLHLMITGTDEIQGLIASGDIIPIVAMSETRMKRYPDMECTGELGIDSYIGTWRAVMCRKGTPQAAIDALEAAIAECVQDPTWQAYLEQGAYDEREGFATAADTQALIDEEYVTFTEYMREQGLLVRDYTAA